MKESLRQSPLATMTEVTQKNMQIWKKMQDDFFNLSGTSKKDKEDD